MSRVSSFGFTNTTEGSNTLTQVALGLTSNYSLTSDAADVVELNNKTAPLDAEELVAFRSRTLDSVKTKSNIQYPAKVGKAIEYSVRIDDTLVTTDTADPSFRVDDPIVCTIAFRHPKSGNITSAHVAQVFLRAISSLMKADGTWRFEDLMRSAERPIVD
jgi:hypothetical protein